MPEITLTLTLEETNLVLEALGQMPYARVYRLVESIGDQAGRQVGTQAGDASAAGELGTVRPA